MTNIDSFLRVCNVLAALKDAETQEHAQRVLYAYMGELDTIDLCMDLTSALGILTELIPDLDAFIEEAVKL